MKQNAVTGPDQEVEPQRIGKRAFGLNAGKMLGQDGKAEGAEFRRQEGRDAFCAGDQDFDLIMMNEERRAG